MKFHYRPGLTEEEHGRIPNNQDSIGDTSGIKPSGGPFADVLTGGKDRLRCTKPYVIGTRNARRMNLGKPDIIKREMERTDGAPSICDQVLTADYLQEISIGLFQNDQSIVCRRTAMSLVEFTRVEL